jgi:hypothetical protein
MSSGKACAALALSLALLSGCGPKKPVAVVSPPAPVPQLPPSRMAAALPAVPPPFPVVAQRTVKLDTTVPPEPKPEVATTQPHKPPKRHTRPAAEDASRASPGSSQNVAPPQVATAEPSDQTSIGQLSTPNDVNAAGRQQISGQIDATENGLNAIKRPLSADEQKTVTLIRQYITRARDALKVDDLDGAGILSSKAKQLLQELTKP